LYQWGMCAIRLIMTKQADDQRDQSLLVFHIFLHGMINDLE